MHHATQNIGQDLAAGYTDKHSFAASNVDFKMRDIISSGCFSANLAFGIHDFDLVNGRGVLQIGQHFHESGTGSLFSVQPMFLPPNSHLHSHVTCLHHFLVLVFEGMLFDFS